MMAPEPEMRPDIESILLHPLLQTASRDRRQDFAKIKQEPRQHQSMPMNYGAHRFNDENSHPNLHEQPNTNS